ncbi:MAG: hypothetical protein FJ026_14255, partial [Chloroflexi bacterium]|nr:hypothetical protein [Chloroflexota bacterium]
MSVRGLGQIRNLVCVALCAGLLGSTSSAGGTLPGLTAGGAVLAQAQNVEFVGQIGGWTKVFAVQGSYVYLGVGLQIEVLDVSNPAAPVKLSSYRGPGQRVADIEIVGHYAYVASGGVGDGNDVLILDISNPAALVKVGGFDTPGAIRGLYVAGHHAYLAAGTAGLRIVDVSNPTAPWEVGLYDVPYPARDVYVAGNYAYVGYGEIYVYASGNFCSTYGGLDVVDISDPSAPRQMGHYDARGGYIDNVQVSGSYAYITGLWCSGKTARQRSHLRVLDVSDPAAPLEVADYTIPRFMHSVCVVQDHAYVAAG